MKSRIYIFFITECVKNPREFCKTNEADGLKKYSYFF